MKQKRDWRPEPRRRHGGDADAGGNADSEISSETGSEAGSGHDTVLIWGMHAAEAALANPARVVRQAWATENAAHRLARGLGERKLVPERVVPRDLDRRLGEDTVHQGILLEVEPLPETELAALAEAIPAKGPAVILDQVTDPHNVGAVLRSAAVFGSAGLVLTRRHSPPLGGALAKAASGALELVSLAPIQNLARGISELRKAGVIVIGLDGASDRLLDEELLSPDLRGRAVALVLGAEGKGLRQLTAESCDRLCRIGGDGTIASLNVSNAAAVALHLAAMARRRG